MQRKVHPRETKRGSEANYITRNFIIHAVDIACWMVDSRKLL